MAILNKEHVEYLRLLYSKKVDVRSYKKMYINQFTLFYYDLIV